MYIAKKWLCLSIFKDETWLPNTSVSITHDQSCNINTWFSLSSHNLKDLLPVMHMASVTAKKKKKNGEEKYGAK